MGVNLYLKPRPDRQKRSEPSYLMGYGSFFRLRKFVAGCVSPEYGEHYAKILQACARQIDVEEYDRKTEMLLKKYHVRERFCSFLYQTDTQGHLSPKMCEALLNGIGEQDTDELFGYTAYPDTCLTAAKFKAMLKKAAEEKMYVVWD